jgi:hypothetical protein
MSKIDLYPNKNGKPSEAEIQTGTVVGNKVAADVNIVAGIVSGTFEPSGLRTNIKASTHIVTDTPTQITPVPLTDRNAVSIRVWGQNTVYFGADIFVTDSNGYPKLTMEELALDIKDTVGVEVWAVCESGKTSELRILEIA